MTAGPVAIAKLELRDLERALEKLPTEQREAILLVGLEGLAYEEVAAILKVPVGTVRSRLSRGRDQLRRLMACRKNCATASASTCTRHRLSSRTARPIWEAPP